MFPPWSSLPLFENVYEIKTDIRKDFKTPIGILLLYYKIDFVILINKRQNTPFRKNPDPDPTKNIRNQIRNPWRKPGLPTATLGKFGTRLKMIEIYFSSNVTMCYKIGSGNKFYYDKWYKNMKNIETSKNVIWKRLV